MKKVYVLICNFECGQSEIAGVFGSKKLADENKSRIENDGFNADIEVWDICRNSHKLSDNDIINIKQMAENGTAKKVIASIYDVTLSYICMLAKNNRRVKK